jgi:hypothetical protein
MNRLAACAPQSKTKNAGRLLAIRHFDVQQQRLNCALIVVSSSLGFFRFQGLNGISEPRIASGPVLAVDL